MHRRKLRRRPFGRESAPPVATYGPSCDLRQVIRHVTPFQHPIGIDGVPSCAKCGRRLAPAERYCTGCGEPSSLLMASGSSRLPRASRKHSRCPRCGAQKAHEASCLECGYQAVASENSPRIDCPSCGTLATDETARFCASCGAGLDAREGIRPGVTAPRGTPVVDGVARLTLLDAMGDVTQIIPLRSSRSTLVSDLLGLQVSDSLIGGDGATIEVDGLSIRIEPVGAPRALFVFINEPTRVEDGDVLLLGSQVVRCRSLPEESGLIFGDRGGEQVGSALPGRDLAVLEQIREDGRVRDTIHLWAGRTVAIGRDQGDWTFPYDPTMSARHATISCGDDGLLTVRDAGSTNGVAVAVRAPQLVAGGQRVSLGGQIMRVDLA